MLLHSYYKSVTAIECNSHYFVFKNKKIGYHTLYFFCFLSVFILF